MENEYKNAQHVHFTAASPLPIENMYFLDRFLRHFNDQSGVTSIFISAKYIYTGRQKFFVWTFKHIQEFLMFFWSLKPNLVIEFLYHVIVIHVSGLKVTILVNNCKIIYAYTSNIKFTRMK